ncbi:hypothetical protein [Shewanella gaetbuli]
MVVKYKVPFLAFLGAMIVMPCANTANIEAVLLGEFSPNRIDLTQMKPMAVLDLLKNNSNPRLTFTHRQMSLPRGWVEITKLDNACMYNKVKTPDREKLAIFSRYPITLYPPLRLIVRASDGQKYANEFDFSTLQPSDYKRYGVTVNRSYGRHLDEQISQQKDALFFRDGENSVGVMVEMLALNRIDGFVEYADTVNAHLQEGRIEFDFKAIPIKGVDKPLPGYFACSKSANGRALINTINEAMSQKAFQQSLIQIHDEFSSIDDKSLLTSELIALFGAESE